MTANMKEIGRICSVQKDSFRILFQGKEFPAVLKGSFYKNNKKERKNFQ